MTNSDPDSHWPNFDRTADGCLPAVAQDADTGEVLMVAYMNRESFRLTLASGQAVYFSRSRKRLWRKGEISGHIQTIESIYLDCDLDAILLKVRQKGVACHEGYRSCFFRELASDGLKVVKPRLVDPRDVYASDDSRGL